MSETPEDLIKRAAKFLDGYERGVITATEASAQVLDCVTDANVAAILALLPDAIREQIISVANDAPTSDTEWQSARYFEIGSSNTNTAPAPQTEAEMEASLEELKLKHRTQVEAIRSAIS